MYKLYAIRIFTTRWDDALRFYRDVIGLPLTFSNADMGWAQFDVGGCFIGLERAITDEEEAEDLVGRFVGASLMVDDITATYDALTRKGVEFLEPPERQPWGGVLAHFKDPDGNVLTLLENPG